MLGWPLHSMLKFYMNNFQFELSTGNLHADQTSIDQVEAGEGPRNLAQLQALGKLLVSSSAAVEIVPLPEILLGREHDDIKAHGYERLDVSQWTSDDYVEYGQWLDSITRGPQQVRSQLTKYVLRCAYDLGIGPSDNLIRRKDLFSKLSSFYKALDILPAFEVGKYDTWSDQDLANHGERVLLALQSKTEGQTGRTNNLIEEIDRWARLGQGPGRRIFRRNGRNVMEIMALNGYADVKNMKPEDYVQLGVRFMEANHGSLPTVRAFDFLCKSMRAPNSVSFLRRFRWADYLEQVQAAYKRPDLYALEQKLPIIKQELKDGTLPHAAISDVTVEQALKHVLNRRAKWLLVNELLPELDAEHKLASTRGINLFFEGLIRTRGNLSDTDIEAAAARLDITEDLWPSRRKPRPYMDYLRVPEELLG